MRAVPIGERTRRFGRLRRLMVEPLEDRRLLAAGSLDEPLAGDAETSPWQNPVFRLDVNDNSFTTVNDALNIVNRILTEGTGPLPDPGANPPKFFYDTSGDNRLTVQDLVLVVNGILSPPTVVVSSLTPTTADVTPPVTVTASGASELPNGTVVELDVDVNGDGDFSDPDERGRVQSTLFEGSSSFEITPALPHTGEVYSINLRARLKDADAVSGMSERLRLEVDTRTSDVLANYVAQPDESFDWEPIRTEDGNGFTKHVIDMTSQTWRSPEEVDLTEWHHELEIWVPDQQFFSTALLLIDAPQQVIDLGDVAALTNSVIVHLPSVPNQPLLFSDQTETRVEDGIIAYTFDKFMRNFGDPDNETWPVLLPMVNSAVRAMDVVQEVVPALEEFVVSGYSKRGWTTWLTAAVDDRVSAIMPGVFDNLNQGPQMVHHYGALGFFADAMRPYTEMQIFERLYTDEAAELWPITDPYRYLHNGRFDDMPKLILNSTGDEFFVPDSSQFYINDLPGDQNYLRYMPNTNHGLGVDEDPTELIGATLSFYASVLNDVPLPEYSWTVEQDGSIRVQTTSDPIEIKLWQSTTSNRDFRIRKNEEARWTSTTLAEQGGAFVGNVPTPESGATAYLVEITFANPLPLAPDFKFTTDVRVKSTLPFHPWPFGAPEVEISTLTPFSADVTPWVTVTTGGAPAVEDGTVVHLDVDLNNDGDFRDLGELSHSQSTMFEQSSTFEITPALERRDEPYTVNLRARVTNLTELEGVSPVLPLEIDTRTSDALANYVNTPDSSYEYSVREDLTADGDGYTYYVLEMTSQTWRSAEDVDDPVWDHWMGVYVPDDALFSTALMAIGGGSNTSDPPDVQADSLGLFAALSGTVVFELTTVPNEPVIFTDETSTRSEDAIIAYTFDKFLENMGEPGNDTWPLLLPMVKSAVRAMDTIQDFSPTVDGPQVDDFVVFGGSKRGWTTWLTAATDDRVRAIMPGVIDVLNMAPQMVHHFGAYGFFSEWVHDYEDMQVFDRLLTDEGRELMQIVDPYSYLNNGRFDDMPMLIVNSAGDEFFVSDSAQFYINDIPGDSHRLRYMANTGHGLDGDRVVQSIVSFYGSVLSGAAVPDYSWTVEQNGEIHVQTSDSPTQVLLWQATNPEARDFRNAVTGLTWTSTPLDDQGGGVYVGDVPMPSEGATAYFVELTFAAAIPTFPHVFSTEVRVKSTLPMHPWPFGIPEVDVSTLTHFTPDVTPIVTVTTPGAPAIDDGTVVTLDVDLNNDGDFDDEGELDYTQSTTFEGSSTFQITPALPRSDEVYTVNLRARVSNVLGLEGISPAVPLEIDTRTSDALADYINSDTFDPSSYSQVASATEALFDYYVLDLTSQTWRSAADVDLPVWQHYVEVYVPHGEIETTAMLLIDGGANTNDVPDQSRPVLGELAVATSSVVIDLKNVPFNPLLFTDETSSRVEDALIAYSFDKFLDNIGEPDNETWPVLLPMVKSVVRTMDMIQDFIPGVSAESTIDDFLVFSTSKRAWTTWLTGAADDRVRAIVPMVFDNLSQAAQMVHHYGVYGFFADAVHDYEDLKVLQRVLTNESRELGPIVDPYYYLANGRFDDMPKLLINSPGDEFFVSDSAQFYFDDIPGEENYLRYIPNVGHGLDLEGPGLVTVVESIVSFYDAAVNGTPLPDYSWTVEQNGEIRVQAASTPSQVLLWQATNPEARDFRNKQHPEIVWTSTPLVDQGGGIYVGDVPMPESGATGYFVELTFSNPSPLLADFIFTTEVRVKSTLPFHPWPFGTQVTPDVEVSSLTPFSADVTPLVTVTASGSPPVADGATVSLDVDLNNDGDFDDEGEFDYTQSTTFDGSSTFQITPALPRSNEVYTVGLRARVSNVEGAEGVSPILPLEIDTLTSTALEDYVNAPDDSYTYSLVSAEASSGYTYVVLDMTSQTWRSAADVDDPVWDHWIGVYIPDTGVGETAMMLISGGSNTSDPPSNSADLGLIAALSGSLVFELRTVPNERVTFTDETFSRTEDEIIAYTFDKYLENIGEPGNETWPLLLPMVKSAVRAMDTIQDFVSSTIPDSQINDFVVTGYSKRGWTTWLTAAVDDRVRAIMPGVIDVLNMGPQMVHHFGAYGFFSEAIHDYQDLNIFERLLTEEGQELGRIVDPYSYLYNGRFDNMPKLILNSAGDEFFVTDSAQFYYDDIPGDQNRLRYFPNTGHGLDDNEVVKSIVSFFGTVLQDTSPPDYSWTVQQNGEIHVQTFDAPTQVLLWQATNPVSRDFRNLLTGDIWTSTELVDQGGGTYIGDVPVPETGATAYLIELTFDSGLPQYPHIFTTEARVKSDLPFHPWPFDVASIGASAAASAAPATRIASRVGVPSETADDARLGAVAAALAIPSGSADSPADDWATAALLPAIEEPDAPAISPSVGDLMLPDSQAAGDSSDAETDAELVDLVFGSTADLVA